MYATVGHEGGLGMSGGLGTCGGMGTGGAGLFGQQQQQVLGGGGLFQQQRPTGLFGSPGQQQQQHNKFDFTGLVGVRGRGSLDGSGIGQVINFKVLLVVNNKCMYF